MIVYVYRAQHGTWTSPRRSDAISISSCLVNTWSREFYTLSAFNPRPVASAPLKVIHAGNLQRSLSWKTPWRSAAEGPNEFRLTLFSRFERQYLNVTNKQADGRTDIIDISLFHSVQLHSADARQKWATQYCQNVIAIRRAGVSK